MRFLLAAKARFGWLYCEVTLFQQTFTIANARWKRVRNERMSVPQKRA